MNFSGNNKIILVEFSDEDNALLLISKYIHGSCIVYTDHEYDCNHMNCVVVKTFDIAKVCQSIRNTNGAFDFSIIHRIDMMGLLMSRRVRGSVIKYNLSTLNRRNLLGSNVIITSGKAEHMIREIATTIINIRP